MTDKEALRVALACTIDRARELPAGQTRNRVREAAHVLNEIVTGREIVTEPMYPHAAR